MAILKFLDPEKKEWKELDVVSDGVTFIPSIAEDGTLSWTNNGHLDNPTPISLLNEAIVMKDYKTDFPPVGTEYTIYIEKTTGAIYRYDSANKEYVPLSTTPSGGKGIIFVNSVPAAADAELGVVYAVKVSEGKKDNFELWAKHNGEMIMLEGSAEESNKELVFANNYQSFPVVGDDEHLYIATEEDKNLIYRWDSVEKTYVTVGDKLGSVDAGDEASAEAPVRITETEVKQLFNN